MDNELLEAVSAAVHEAWMETKRQQGITSRLSESGEELVVPYPFLPEAAKELDRGSVRATLAAAESAGYVLVKRPRPSDPKTVRIRIPVAVNDAGHWFSAAGTDRSPDEGLWSLKETVRGAEDAGGTAVVRWIEADVPLPEPLPVIVASETREVQATYTDH